LYEGIGGHALPIKISLFDDITNIEKYSTGLLLVVNFEIVPIGVTFGIGVTSQEQIIFVLFDPYSHVQIAAFKGRIERNLRI
jgi:hypothetical protein